MRAALNRNKIIKKHFKAKRRHISVYQCLGISDISFGCESVSRTLAIMGKDGPVAGHKRKAAEVEEEEPDLEYAEEEKSQSEGASEEEVAARRKGGRGARAKGKAKGKSGVEKGSKVIKKDKRTTAPGRDRARKASVGTKWCRGVMLELLSLDF